MASSVVHKHVLTRTYRGICAKRNRQGTLRNACHLPALSSPLFANSWSDFTPRLIFTRCNSLRNRVLCRRIACFTGPSPACIPRDRRRSCTSTSARLRVVIFFSSFSNLDALITSTKAPLSDVNGHDCHFLVLPFVDYGLHFRVSITKAAVLALLLSGRLARMLLMEPSLESRRSRTLEASK